MSGPPPSPTSGLTATDALRCIAVRVGESLYGIAMQDVQEVVGLRPLTRVFHAPPALAGITSLRGEVLPVIDLAALLGLPPRPEPDARIVVAADRTQPGWRAGLRVAALVGLRDFPAEGLAPVPPGVPAELAAVFQGVLTAAPPCLVLSVPALLRAPALQPLSGVAC